MVEAQRATSGRLDEVPWLVSGHGKEMMHGLAGTLCLAIRLANATQHGLAATIWTRDVSHAHLLARKVRAGAVSVNGWATIDPALPWAA